jgi:hypothetical protein
MDGIRFTTSSLPASPGGPNSFFDMPGFRSIHRDGCLAQAMRSGPNPGSGRENARMTRTLPSRHGNRGACVPASSGSHLRPT